MKRYERIMEISTPVLIQFLREKDVVECSIYHSSWKKSEDGVLYRIKDGDEVYGAIGTADFKMVKSNNTNCPIPEFKYRKLLKLTQKGWDFIIEATVIEKL